MSAVYGYRKGRTGESGIILCAREYLNSLADSSLEEIKRGIEMYPFLVDYYEVGDRYIKSRDGRIAFAFAGLRTNLNSIKSKSRVLLCWLDEAGDISEIAYQKLLPTVRAEGSEIWITYNPESQDSPTDKRFRQETPKGCKIVEMNYQDNPWFPNTLNEERLSDLERLDPATYAWIWDGAYRVNSDAQIFSGHYKIEEFEPVTGEREPSLNWDGPYYGLDWGFSQDPTAAVEMWIYDGVLYIRREACKAKLELDQTAEYIKRCIPGIENHIIRADNARPESISFVKRHGLPRLEGVDKWKGSVEDGIEHMKSYRKIVVHPSCHDTIREFRLYSYKVDRLTGDIKPDILDANNHLMDACRYAIAPIIKKAGYSWAGFE